MYRHSESVDFHRVLIVIENCELACLQYYFDGQEHEVKSAVPHGNARLKRSQKPYIRTKKPVLKKIKKSSLPPKQYSLIGHYKKWRLDRKYERTF